MSSLPIQKRRVNGVSDRVHPRSRRNYVMVSPLGPIVTTAQKLHTVTKEPLVYCSCRYSIAAARRSGLSPKNPSPELHKRHSQPRNSPLAWLWSQTTGVPPQIAQPAPSGAGFLLRACSFSALAHRRPELGLFLRRTGPQYAHTPDREVRSFSSSL